MLIWELLEGYRADQCACCEHDGACDHRHDADCGHAGANGDTQSSSTIDGERPPRQSSWHEAARINAGWNVVKAPKKPTAFKPAKRRKPRITKPMKCGILGMSAGHSEMKSAGDSDLKSAIPI